MNRDIYNTIQREYERRQKQAIDLSEQRKAELYQSLPELAEIEAKINSIGVRYARLMLSHGIDRSLLLDELNNKTNELLRLKADILDKNHIAADYLEIPYQCLLCNDTGFVSGSVGSQRCACYKQQVISYLFSQSNINLNGNESFSAFDDSLYPDEADAGKFGITISPQENIRLIKSTCMDFIKNFDDVNQKNLFLNGRTGVGKTFLSFCIARELLEQGRTVLYLTAPALFDIITEHKMMASKDEFYNDERYKSIFSVELLIIDDLGTEPLSDARYAELLNILNTRQSANSVSACKTIISTNLGPKKLFELYTERVASRIMGHFERLILAGIDIRSLRR